MRVRLIPLACPELGVIDVRDALIGVGRDRGDFRRLPPARVERLASRHARLFTKNGALFVVDLGSRHGTFVNGQAISDKPVELKQDDEVDFGGELPFRVDLIAAGAEPISTQAAEVTLVLEPVDLRNGPDPLKITSFPFLVSKNAPAFAKYGSRAAAELDFISRRHAELARQDGQILVRDLGSTNGTLVDGQRLGAEPLALDDGQVLAFGGDYFVYRVSLQGQAQARPPLEARPKGGQSSTELDKTTFLAAGTSFLDILCADPAAAAQPEGGAEEESASEGDAAEASRRGGWLSRLKKASSRLDRTTWRRLQLVAVAALVLAGTLGYLASRESPTERMESLLASGRAEDALEVARASAASLGGTTVFDRLSLRALVAKTLGPWLDAYDANGYDQMREILEAGREASPVQLGNLEYLDTLGQIGDAHRAVSERGGPTARLRVLDAESEKVRAIVDAWNRPSPDKRKVEQGLLGAVPPSDAELLTRYRKAYQKGSSDIRALETQLSVYEPAVEQLERTIARHLDEGSLSELESDLRDYAERYSQFGGFDELQRDLSKYRALVEASSQQRVMDAVQLARTTQFHAPPFAQAADRLMREQLPDQGFLDAYASAVTAWRAGKVEDAIKELESLSSGASGQIARSEIERMQGIVDRVNALQTLEPSPAYDERLLSLYHSLDADRDQYILNALRAEYEDSRKAVQGRARQAAAEAASAWAAYRERGGITSTQRLRSGINQEYKERAAMLSRAASGARQARQLYEEAQSEPPPGQQSTLGLIEREVALQHQALDELVGVVAESTLRGKHALLPEREKQVSSQDE